MGTSVKTDKTGRDEPGSLLGRVEAELSKAENEPLVGWLVKAEEATGQPRTLIFAAVAGSLGLYLMVGNAAGLVCNLLGFLFPLYASLGALASQKAEDLSNWIVYWFLFAFLSLFDVLAEAIMERLPLYWLLKAINLIWLQAPSTNGVALIYAVYLKPLLDARADLFPKAK